MEDISEEASRTSVLPPGGRLLEAGMHLPPLCWRSAQLISSRSDGGAGGAGETEERGSRRAAQLAFLSGASSFPGNGNVFTGNANEKQTIQAEICRPIKTQKLQTCKQLEHNSEEKCFQTTEKLQEAGHVITCDSKHHLE